ncbi:MAG TPA: hypothetical protein PK765_03580 [bacterium]|nr:hypothetical protein [bacterium]
MAVLGLVAASALLASCELPGSPAETDTASGASMEDTVSTGSSMEDTSAMDSASTAE